MEVGLSHNMDMIAESLCHKIDSDPKYFLPSVMKKIVKI